MPGALQQVRLSTLLAIAAFLPALRASATPPAGYYLVWNDEFNGTALDTTRWDYWLPGNRRDAVNIANAVSVGGGYLTITTYTSNNVHYTGMIATDGRFRSRYGYWESSIKWGDTNGMWSAFWMQSPTMGTYLSDPQVSGSEIDIDEHRYVDSATNNIANRTQSNLHWNGYGSSAQSAGSGNVGSGLATGFHTYGLLWTPNSYSFRIDDTQVYNGGSAPVSHSCEWAILSSEVDDTSTTWAGYIPSGGYGSLAANTTKLTVDYVRYYAPTNVLFWIGSSSAYWTNSSNWIANLNPGNSSDVTFSMLSANLNPILGQDSSVDGLIFLNTGNSVTVGGTNMLTLGAGGIDLLAANHTVTINAPVQVGAAQTWAIGPNNPGNTLNVNGRVSGTNPLTKSSYGTIILAASNSFSGRLNVDTGSNMANDGAVRVAHSAALADVASPIYIANNNSGSSTLQLDGTSGAITLTQGLQISCRNNTVPALQNRAGNNTLAGDLLMVQGGSNVVFQSDSGVLNFTGAIRYVGSLIGNRTWNFLGSATTVVAGPILNSTNGSVISLSKSGTGMLTLAGANTFTGATTVSAGTLQVNGNLGPGVVNIEAGGTLAGNGLIAGPVTIQAGAILSPGPGTGPLTINNALTLAGTTVMELNAATGTNDQVRGVTSLNYGGTLTVNNLGGVLAAGARFNLFSADSSSGAFAVTNLPALGAALAWSFDPVAGTLRVVSTIQANLEAHFLGNTLALSWPDDHTGWRLQSQTNPPGAGLGPDWSPVPGSTTTNQMFFPVLLQSGSLFYRLVFP